MNNQTLARTTTDPKILNKLSKDEDWMVRCRVADNLNTSQKDLDYLSKDEYWAVRRCVIKNPNTSPEILKEMYRIETNTDVKNLIKNNPNYSKES
ncbi:hypothetical protein EBR43_05430 [bacterium]|nr:hypothetical protein [bacterium]